MRYTYKSMDFSDNEMVLPTLCAVPQWHKCNLSEFRDCNDFESQVSDDVSTEAFKNAGVYEKICWLSCCYKGASLQQLLTNHCTVGQLVFLKDSKDSSWRWLSIWDEWGVSSSAKSLMYSNNCGLIFWRLNDFVTWVVTACWKNAFAISTNDGRNIYETL